MTTDRMIEELEYAVVQAVVTGCSMDRVKAAKAALKSTIEELVAEEAAAQVALNIAHAQYENQVALHNKTLDELKIAYEMQRCECSAEQACQFAIERDALKAELVALQSQKPVAWMVNKSWDDIEGVVVHKEQSARYCVPLYAAGAKEKTE